MIATTISTPTITAAPTAPPTDTAPPPTEAAETPPAEGAPETATAQAPQSEPPKAEKPPEQDRSARAFAALAKREKAIRERETALKQQEREHQQSARLRELAQQDPVAAMEALGIRFDSVVDRILGSQPDDSPEGQLKQIRAQLEEQQRRETEREKAAEQARVEQGVAQWKRQIESTVREAGDKYELIAAHEAYDDVWQAMHDYFQANGVAPDLETVLRATEEALQEDAERALKTKRFASRLSQSVAPKSTEPTQSQTGKTLTNSIQGEAPQKFEELPMNPDERTRAQLKALGILS